MPNGTVNVNDTPAEGQPRGCVGVWTFLPAYGRDGEVKAWSLLDREDYERAQHKRWHLHSDGYFTRHLSRRTEGRGKEFLHREVLGLARGDAREGDHANRDRHDNRRSNLRITDSTGNKQNVSERTARARGVDFRPRCRRRPWRARVKVNGRTVVAHFATAAEAEAAAVAFRAEHLPMATD